MDKRMLSILRITLAIAALCITLCSRAVADEPQAKEKEAATAQSDTASDAKPAANSPGLPFVYTDWTHFTTKDGLPNDHIFAVKAFGPKVWIGTAVGSSRNEHHPLRRIEFNAVEALAISTMDGVGVAALRSG